MAAGTLTITYSETRTVRRVVLDWLSSAAGAVNGTLTKALSGQLLRVVFIPDGGGTQPTDSYDLVLNDEDGVDVLAALGANLSNVNTTQVVPGVTNGTAGNWAPMAVDGTLELQVTNAGNAKGGQVILYVR